MSQTPPGDDASRRFYDHALREGRSDAERVGWDSSAVQRYRLAALLEVLAPVMYSRPLRVLDVGCGMGALVKLLEVLGWDVDYVGIDAHPEMIARARSAAPNHHFECVELLEWKTPCDVAICCGTFSVCDPAEGWRAIEHLYSLARWAVSLDLQRRRPGPGALRTDFWYVDPAQIAPRLRELCPRLVIREDVLPSELVIYLYKDHARSLAPRLGLFSPEDLAEIHLQRGRPDDAVRALDACDGHDDATRAGNLRAVALGADQPLEDTAAMLEAAHGARPGDSETAGNLLRILGLLGRRARALSVLTETLAAGEHPMETRDELRQIVHDLLASAGDHTGAEQLAETAEGACTRALMRAHGAGHRGDWSGCRAGLERALMLRPWDETPRVLLAEAMCGQGAYDEALEQLARVLIIDPTHDDARDAARRVIQHLPEQPEPRLQRRLEALRAHRVLGSLLERGRR